MDTTIRNNEINLPNDDNVPGNSPPNNPRLDPNSISTETGSKQQRDSISKESMENLQKCFENLRKSMEKLRKSTENLKKTLDNAGINTPILSRSASVDKSENYIDADDNTIKYTDINESKPSEGVNIPDPLRNPNQALHHQTPANTSILLVYHICANKNQ